jgi:hypothetical protein
MKNDSWIVHLSFECTFNGFGWVVAKLLIDENGVVKKNQ